MKSATLRISEIFYSLQGETSTTGLPTVFIRLTGCPLRCVYCDTTYAFQGGDKITLDEILQKVAHYGAKYVTVTGGEPLAQDQCIHLLTALCDCGYRVSLETSGALSVKQVDQRVHKIVDIKTPGSGEVNSNLYENIQYLHHHDEVKFVICNRKDYDWSCLKMDLLGLPGLVSEILFSPSQGELTPRELADWILADKLNVRMQLQAHKYIWGDQPGH